MPGATLKLVARLAGVAPVTVSRVVNGSERVASATREKILAIIRDVDYRPNIHATKLRLERVHVEPTSARRNASGCGDVRLRSGTRSHEAIERRWQEHFAPTPAEETNLLQFIAQLCRDLDGLRRDTERIQRCVDSIKQARTRQNSLPPLPDGPV